MAPSPANCRDARTSPKAAAAFCRVPETPEGGRGRRLLGGAARAAAAAMRAARVSCSMRAALHGGGSVVVAAGLFAQGLLAGVAALNLFMTYFPDAAELTSVTEASGFLHYYSPIAVTCQRLYVTLSVMACPTRGPMEQKQRHHALL